MRDGDMRKEVADVISNDPVFNKQRRPHMSRFERVQDGLAMTKRLMEICDEREWDYMQCVARSLVDADRPGTSRPSRHAASTLVRLTPSPHADRPGVYLHARGCGARSSLPAQEVAFQPVIQAQGSDEQHEEWCVRVRRLVLTRSGWPSARTTRSSAACVGLDAPSLTAAVPPDGACARLERPTQVSHAFAALTRTELETTATYDPKTEEFEIHSPHLSSTKWWIGCAHRPHGMSEPCRQAGVAATHGVVQAQLITGGQSRGPHLFIVQLRDRGTSRRPCCADGTATHKVLPGLTIGDIGPKAHGGFAALDNGFIRFDRVRIPRSQMLNRFAKVHADGTYVKPPNSKLSYGGMVFIRAQMISNSGWSLSRAATIATRYAHVRRQFVDPDDPTLSHGSAKLERQVIHYASVHLRPSLPPRRALFGQA